MRELERMLLEGRYILTHEVKRFEADFGEYLGGSLVRGVKRLAAQCLQRRLRPFRQFMDR